MFSASFLLILVGLDKVARHVAIYLKRGHSSALLRSIYSKVMIVIKEFSFRIESDVVARERFLKLLREKTLKGRILSNKSQRLIWLPYCQIILHLLTLIIGV